MDTKPAQPKNDERDFTPPLVDGIEVQECVCSFKHLPFHATHAKSCSRFCKDCFIIHPCALHRACNYIFYRSHPLPGCNHYF